MFLFKFRIFVVGWVMSVVYLIVDVLWNDLSGVMRWCI